MKKEMREKILAFNRERAKDKEAAQDLTRLLSALPPGQVRNLLHDEICGPILRKYGIY